MFGLGFLNSLFLLALGATALPIVIHILNRRRVRKIRFSSLEFIAELNKRRMSKVNLRRWIILLLRTLAVAFLALAFARPTIRGGVALLVPGEVPQHVVICLDASYSMAAEQETGTAFTNAQALAGRVVDECRKNDLVNVVAFSTRSDILFDEGTRNKRVVKSAINELEVSAEGTSIPGAIETAAELIENSDMTAGEIYVISDFREPEDSVLGADLPENTKLILLPVYREAVENVSIDHVFTPRKLIRPGEVVRVGVAVTNHSAERSVDFPLELLVGGDRKAEKIVNLSPGSSATVTFVVSMNEWGSYRCRVAKPRDRLPIDDERFFVMDVSKKIPVTLIRGRKYAEGNATEPAAAFFFVDKALNPRDSPEGEFDVTVIDQGDLTVADLPARGVTVWTDPQRMDARRFDLLKRYIRRGGAMMVFLGSDPGGFWRDNVFRRYLGIQDAVARDRPEAVGFSSFAGAHPIFAVFNEEELELFSRGRMAKYVSATGVSPDSTVAYLDGGDPGMWECRRDQGRIVVFAASPDLASGNLPLSPMFLPVVHTTASYLASAGEGVARRENIVGDDLFFDLPPKWRAQTAGLRVRTEDGGDTEPLLSETGQGEATAMLSRPRKAGFYALLSDTTWIADACVNVDTRESNLNARSLEETVVEQGTVLEASDELSENLRQARQGREIYAVFLLLAAAMLAGEALLGRKA